MFANKVSVINQLNDNYSYILFDKNNACIIDPAESLPILEYVKKNNLIIKDIFITHHHGDHTSGVEGILNVFPHVAIHSPSSHIKNTRYILRDNEEINSCVNSFKILSTPGHTTDHIIYYDEFNKLLFSGDTLFRLGCGRVFEGTLQQMYNSLQKINQLNDEIIVYCGHEYTLNNLSFLESVLQNKELLSEARVKIEDELHLFNKTVPFSLKEEKIYNLFLNQNSNLGKKTKEKLSLTDFELFKFLRDQKDIF